MQMLGNMKQADLFKLSSRVGPNKNGYYLWTKYVPGIYIYRLFCLLLAATR